MNRLTTGIRIAIIAVLLGWAIMTLWPDLVTYATSIQIK